MAVGVTWLGAAAVRLGSLKLDRPRTDWTFWAFLAAEIAFGATALGLRSYGLTIDAATSTQANAAMQTTPIATL
jgi:hypothetical protein